MMIEALAPLTPGDDPRLPDLGVPVGPLDHERLCRVFPPGRVLGWVAARELLVALLAKDEGQRRALRGEFRRRLPPVPVQAPADLAAPPATAGAGPADPDSFDLNDTGLAPVPDAAPAPTGPVTTRAQRRRPWWRLALGATLGTLLVLTAWSLSQDWRTAEPPSPSPVAPAPAPPPPPASELPAHPLPTFNDWVPLFEAPTPAARLLPWLGPLALLCAGLLALAWLWERARRVLEPPWTQVDYRPEGEPVFAWTPEHLRLPNLLGAQARRELVWGVQRFASERATDRLDIGATVHASAASGLPEPRFAPARYEREVWLWLDTRLRTREAVALADQIERDLVRAGLWVRRGTFVGWPDWIRLRTRERTSPLDLGPAARHALVCLFTDGVDLARALDRGTGEDGAALQRVLRELRTWPRLCLVDLAPPDLDLPALAARLGLDCCTPAALPAWLAERPDRARGPREEGPAPTALALRLWAAACALPRLPVTAAQARALYEDLAEPLGLPPVWRLPAPGRGQAGPDGTRFSDRERQALLRDLARWAAEDGWGGAAGAQSEVCRALARALAFWDATIQAGAASLERVSDAWDQGPADRAQAIERLLLALWWGDGRSAAAGRALYDLYQQEALQPMIRERLAGLDTRAGADADPDGGRIRLPWTWAALPEAPAPTRQEGESERRAATPWERLQPRPARADAPSVAGHSGPGSRLKPLPREELAGRHRLYAALVRLKPRPPVGNARAAAVPPDWAAERTADGGSAREPPGTARQRLLRMGFAGAAPCTHPRLGAATLLLLGAGAGLVLAGAIGLTERLAEHLGAGRTGDLVHQAQVYDGDLFQGLVMEGRQGGRPYAASRKLTAIGDLGAGARLHWCWSGLAPERAAPACRALSADPMDPRRINPLPMGKSALLRAGTLAEPIRACAPGWPALSVAVIEGDRWDWPANPHNNEAARRLAIRLLDRGAVDLALIGPDWAEQAQALAAQWSFAPDTQWLFFAAAAAKTIEQQVPPLGTHRALFTGDLEAMARALDFPGARPAAEALGPAATVTTLAGTPYLWGGPELTPDPHGIPFVHACPGTFTMGSAGPDTPEHVRPRDDEGPAHPVVLDGFWISRTETTQAQYAALTGGTAPDAPDQAVAAVDWKQADDFCRGLAADADLPTEAQWEYAARSGSQDPYPFPSDLAGLCTYANGLANENPDWDWRNKECSDPYQRAAPVGRFPPNPLGLYDMHGNLREWVRDCVDDKSYADRGPHPTATPMQDEVACGWRVLRGGSFEGVPRALRSADRRWDAPEVRHERIGVRCVRGSVRQPSP